MRFDVLTLFPDLFGPHLSQGVTRRAFESGQVAVRLWQLRDFALDAYRRVDDRPFGGGPGMMMLAEPLERALAAVRADRAEAAAPAPLIHFTPAGRPLTQARVRELAGGAGAILLCGNAADLAFAAARRSALCISMAGIAAAMPGGMRDVLAADAEAYPSRPIRLVVPSAPGTGDVAPRLIAGKLAEALGQPVILENRPGASYNIASDAVAKAAPDGHTLLWMGSVITVLPSVLGPTAVDPVKSFSPVAKVLRMSQIVVVHPSLGVRTLDELLALARQKPGQIAYATPGIGTIPHLVATMIEQRASVELLHVPYTNAGQLLKDLLAGEVPVYFTFQVAEPR